jgi:fructokinase
VGADPLGTEALRRMHALGLDTDGVQIDRRRPTGRAVVSVSGGEPGFELLRDQAYDFIDAGGLPPLGPEHSLLYHGSLAARSSVSAAALRAARARALPIFVDVNLRPPWWKPELVTELLSGARWIKANEHELRALGADEQEGLLLDRAESLRRRYGPHAVIATSGSEGALAVTADYALAEPAAPIESFADSVGAGDAFSAVAVLGLSSGWSWRVILQRAAAFAAAICGIHGALPADAAFHRRFIEQWHG